MLYLDPELEAIAAQMDVLAADINRRRTALETAHQNLKATVEEHVTDLKLAQTKWRELRDEHHRRVIELRPSLSWSIGE